MDDGRWTLGLYNTIGLDDESKNLMIANLREEYTAKAVELGAAIVGEEDRKVFDATFAGIPKP